jgi:uncharacterized DUF497 family protein
VEFEFDPAKSQANKAKHGIDFEAAQALWQAKNYVEYDAVFNDENRAIRIAPLKEQLWFCVFTMRGEKIMADFGAACAPEGKKTL